MMALTIGIPPVLWYTCLCTVRIHGDHGPFALLLLLTLLLLDSTFGCWPARRELSQLHCRRAIDRSATGKAVLPRPGLPNAEEQRLGPVGGELGAAGLAGSGAIRTGTALQRWHQGGAPILVKSDGLHLEHFGNQFRANFNGNCKKGRGNLRVFPIKCTNKQMAKWAVYLFWRKEENGYVTIGAKRMTNIPII
jgi:hypothetical protein